MNDAPAWWAPGAAEHAALVRADERARIVAYLRSLGGWGAVAAAAIEGDDYWRHDRAELVRDRRWGEES